MDADSRIIVLLAGLVQTGVWAESLGSAITSRPRIAWFFAIHIVSNRSVAACANVIALTLRGFYRQVHPQVGCLQM